MHLIHRRDRHLLDRISDARDREAQMAGVQVKYAPVQLFSRAGFGAWREPENLRDLQKLTRVSALW